MSDKWKKATAAAAALLAPAIGLAAWAAHADGIPAEPAMYYSGTLEEDGFPVDGMRDIRLVLWDDPTSTAVGNRLCRATPPGDTMVEEGRFRIPLEDTGACTQAIRDHSEVWIEVIVESVSLGRSKIGAVPYAIEAESAQNGAPAGSIVAFGGAVAPPGWVACDGTALSSSAHPELFAAIRTAWGNGTDDADPATDFNLPDLRGMFLRGVDGGAGQDPEAATRTAGALGGNEGDRVGSFQDGEIQSHSHILGAFTGSSSHDGIGRIASGDDGSQAINRSLPPVLAAGGTETRPVNSAVLYVIKL